MRQIQDDNCLPSEDPSPLWDFQFFFRSIQRILAHYGGSAFQSLSSVHAGQETLFKAMLFGLNIAPQIFTSLINCVIKVLHLQGVQAVAYLDEWQVWAPTKCVSGIVGH